MMCVLSCRRAVSLCLCFFFHQKTAYEIRMSDWNSDVCSSDLRTGSKQAGPTSPGPWLRKRSLAAPLFAVRNFSGGIAHDQVGDSLSCVRTTGDTYWRQGSELRATIVLT